MILRPSDNLLNFHYKKFTIDYVDVHELVQGGPETGCIQINSLEIKGYRFGTNLLFHDAFVITSAYKWPGGIFHKQGFIPCAISLSTKEVILFGQPEILCMPKEIVKNGLLYYVDLNNKILKSIELPPAVQKDDTGLE